MQKALLKATRETKVSKELDVIKKAVKQNHNTKIHKEAVECHKLSTNTVASYMNQEDVQSMARNLPGTAQQITFNGCAEMLAKEYQETLSERREDMFMTCLKTLRTHKCHKKNMPW